MKQPKVFVAGATGVVGTRAVRQLVAAGHDVTGIARSTAKSALLESVGAAPARVDLFDQEALAAAVAGCDVVVNLATHIPSFREAMRPSAWSENDRIRRNGSRALAAAARAAGASRYVQESVTFMYPDHGDQWIDEKVPPASTGVTESVLQAEARANEITDGGGIGIVLRFAAFYAPDSSHTQDMVRYGNRHVAIVAGHPDAYMSFIHAEDAGAAVVAALSAPAGTYNVVDDEPVTRRECAEIMGAAVDARPWLRVPGRAARLAGKKADVMTRSQRVSNRAFKAATGWAPVHTSIREGLPAVVAEIEAGERVDA